MPTAAEMARVERSIPGARVQILVREGEDLSQLMDQDSYTFCLAQIFIGGDNQNDILRKYRRATEMLDFGLSRSVAAA